MAPNHLSSKSAEVKSITMSPEHTVMSSTDSLSPLNETSQHFGIESSIQKTKLSLCDVSNTPLL